jgi:hypothetical protein
MTAEYLSFLDSSLAAERCGDAATALEYHRGIPMFTRSRHTHLLAQLAGLAEEMTPWLWARWAAYQCTRAEDAGTESGFITRAALDYTLSMFYADEMRAAYDEGRDPMEVMRNVVGESWVYQQVCTFELGALQEFLDFFADGALAENASWARPWGGAEMRGVRLEAPRDGRLVVTDLSDGREVELLDLGAGTLCEPGGHLVGRQVPSGVGAGTIFDSAPVVVDEQTAREVADSDPGAWITALADAIADGRLDISALEIEDRELVSDVPSKAILDLVTRPADRARVHSEGRDGRDVVGRSAFLLLRSAAEGTLTDADNSPYVAAAVLQPPAYDEALGKLVTPGQPSRWLRWAALVPDPARGRLTRLAERSATIAA